MYSKLVDANPNMVVYKKEDLPERFHYQHNIRIMPILIESKEGWTIMQNRTGPFMRTYHCVSIFVAEHVRLCSFFPPLFQAPVCSINSFTRAHALPVVKDVRVCVWVW